MTALVTTRLLFLVGDSLSVKRFSRFPKGAPRSIRLFTRISHDNGPLTLSSLGFRSELETTTTDEKNNLQQISSTIKVPKSKVKVVRSAGVRSVIERNPLELEAAPFSAKSFEELGLPSLLIERLEREGFTVPTDVQSSAIPTILKNHDVVIQSYTGSGKTLAYLLPILSGVGPLNELQKTDKPRKKMDIEAVIVAPSRELGMQIVREVEKLLGPDEKKLVQQLVGGANRTRQEEALRKNKPAIIVGTPGRLAEISASGKLHTHDCRYLVLDEVDELLSFNFREDMHRILEHVGKRPGAGKSDSKIPTARKAGRQTIMVSATVPFSVVRAARSWGCDPLLVQAKKVVTLDSVTPSGPVNLTGTLSGSTSTSAMQTPSAVQSLPPALKHYYCVARLQHKIDTLRRCVHALDAKSVIAFMNHSRQLKDAVYKLEARGMNAIELHGDLGKLARSTILKKFKSGQVRVLVTNELSARGLDIPECDLVVNLDLPTDSIHYAHRAGRTGRLGRNGSVVTICEEREVFIMKKMQKQLAVPIQACDFAEGKLLVTEEKTSDTESHQESRNG